MLAHYAGAPERLNGRQIPVAGGLDVTFHEPLGVVGVIVPWNFPMPIASWGLAPALAAGNAVLLKPAELTPLTARHLAALGREAGLPEGLLQVLPGRGAVVGRFLVEHEAVRKICFTGSVPVGQAIMAACAAQTKRVTLELGGKSPNISVNSHSSVRYSTPFGGFKQSGLGRELGPDAPLAFTEEKNVFIATS